MAIMLQDLHWKLTVIKNEWIRGCFNKFRAKKRKITLTERGLINKIETIQKGCIMEVNKIKSVKLSLKELMKDDKKCFTD